MFISMCSVDYYKTSLYAILQEVANAGYKAIRRLDPLCTGMSLVFSIRGAEGNLCITPPSNALSSGAVF